ncbi:4-(cytidine 5'-diphospho)-2-C-methyl-D-erythritol kinase [Uliginosibacterium sp. H3]|uniref:4-diphosphocytidyl-2-C-methyl-D-erythritol kinase n=1 Tax=Uliginosibacterium silvisoli TaxID=3114758 RepID=A0ABU6K2N7_9RHOO|nr:4-(cytidine 5'-diphospho)-2-C-methyl-D-erythritol kinase [Uliginosibacterium sp. H3]
MGALGADAAGFIACPAPAKINLFLHVTGRRSDGYHTLQTAFLMLDHGDVLHFRVRADGAIHRVNDVPGVPPEQDLVIRAALLLKEKTGCSRGADIRVDKRLPMGGGLGGGSSDAATTLLALNKLWQLEVPRQTLQDWAVSLGADVPFFVFGRTALAEGIGETLVPLHVPTSWYVVVEPPVAVPTPEIFRDKGLTRDTEAVIISASPVGGELQADVQEWFQRHTRNDLQPVACRLYPEVQKALDALVPFGFSGAGPRMSGSGACVFLPCSSRAQAEKVVEELKTEWRVWCAPSIELHPLHAWASDQAA